MEPPHIDRPLLVERLMPADLNAAAQAVATILAIAHGITPAPGKAPFSLVVRWEESLGGERWVIGLADVTVPLDYARTTADADRLLQPILRLMRPRAVQYVFRSWMDEATPEELSGLVDAMAQAMSMPSPEYIEPRWVEDRTVQRVAAPTNVSPEALNDARLLLTDISTRASRWPMPGGPLTR